MSHLMQDTFNTLKRLLSVISNEEGPETLPEEGRNASSRTRPACTQHYVNMILEEMEKDSVLTQEFKDDVNIAGLLHDVEQALLAKHGKADVIRAQMETLVKRHNLPESVWEIISNHHKPAFDTTISEGARILAVADTYASKTGTILLTTEVREHHDKARRVLEADMRTGNKSKYIGNYLFNAIDRHGLRDIHDQQRETRKKLHDMREGKGVSNSYISGITSRHQSRGGSSGPTTQKL